MFSIFFYDPAKRKPNTYREIYAYGSSLANRDTMTSRFAKEEMGVPSDHVRGVYSTYKGIAIAIPVLNAKNHEMEASEIEDSLIEFLITCNNKLTGANAIYITDLSLDNRVDDKLVYNTLLNLVNDYNTNVDELGYPSRVLLVNKKYKRGE
jgi:hypothetical protein